MAIAIFGAPSFETKYARARIPRLIDGQWVMLPPDQVLAQRMVHVHPGELLKAMYDNSLRTVILDVRSEADYNLFHIRSAVNVPLAMLPSYVPTLLEQQSLNTVYILVSNDESAATQAWKILVAESMSNVYIRWGCQSLDTTVWRCRRSDQAA